MKTTDFNYLIQKGEIEIFIKIEDQLRKINFNKELFSFNTDACCVDLVRGIKAATEAITQDWRD